MDFAAAKSLFENDKLKELGSSPKGVRFLKLRSMSRKAEMAHLLSKHNIAVQGKPSREWLQLLYNSSVSDSQIDDAIRELYELKRAGRKMSESDLINEMNKIQTFEWGGLHQNSLEKTIVDNYIKKITSFDSLTSSVDNQLHNSLKAYVLASWYNHWTSITIEDIFKDHPAILPAVGLIKKVDFFIKNKPFDLKVTYLPEGFIKQQRKEMSLSPELTVLKKAAREFKIPYDKEMPDAALIPDLWKKVQNSPSSEAREKIQEMDKTRNDILEKCQRNPEILAKWLYENQGVRRFDSANRLFLVLVDKENYFESWKLKRATQLIKNRVDEHLSSLPDNPGIKIDFTWEGKSYAAETDIIFVVKKPE